MLLPLKQIVAQSQRESVNTDEMPGLPIEPLLDGQPKPKNNRAYPYQRNSLPIKVRANGEGIIWYRSDYELRYLKVARLCRVKIEASFKSAARKGDVPTMLQCSRELREWCERERSLLRIARPAAEAVRQPKSVHRLDRDSTPTVMEAQEVQPGPESK